jgi:hypothetical protein
MGISNNIVRMSLTGKMRLKNMSFVQKIIMIMFVWSDGWQRMVLAKKANNHIKGDARTSRALCGRYNFKGLRA